MKNVIALFAAALCLFLSSCHLPIAYLQRTPHPAATRLSVEPSVAQVEALPLDSAIQANVPPVANVPLPASSVVVSRSSQPEQRAGNHIERRMHRMQSLLSASTTKLTDQQPDPRPKKKLKLGNQIRQGLGMRLRPELNWWQRISWKLKASVLIILVAVLFAILHITILAIIFGILGAFLLITGLKRSFKVKRPWF
ncbi:hypothetical protein [Spirosoma flavum]|uniref:Uncharacterized protein n=1 Tax=Spirosoma flavum TaxID=2048557 RepID=A0ABW6AMB4_9BACT